MTTMQMGMTGTTWYPPPCEDHNGKGKMRTRMATTTTAPNCHHKQLLMGWKQGAMRADREREQMQQQGQEDGHEQAPPSPQLPLQVTGHGVEMGSNDDREREWA